MFPVCSRTTGDSGTEASVTIRHESLAWVDPISSTAGRIASCYGWPWEDLELIYLESGFFSSTDRLTVQLRSAQKMQSAAVEGVVKMVSLDGQRTEHRLCNVALIPLTHSKHAQAGRTSHSLYITYIRMGPASDRMWQ